MWINFVSVHLQYMYVCTPHFAQLSTWLSRIPTMFTKPPVQNGKKFRFSTPQNKWVGDENQERGTSRMRVN